MPLYNAIIVYNKARNIKIIKLALFLCPTQLLINGQWWSKPSTHFSHILQWTAVDDHKHLQ